MADERTAASLPPMTEEDEAWCRKVIAKGGMLMPDRLAALVARLDGRIERLTRERDEAMEQSDVLAEGWNAKSAEVERLRTAIETARRHLKDRDIWVGRERAADALDAALGGSDG